VAVLKWVLLAVTIGLEVTGSLSLKAALDHPGWYVVVAIGYLGAFVLLSRVLKLGMAIGVAYGIWGACGVALTALFSALLFGEPLTVPMLLGIGLGSQRAQRRRAEAAGPESAGPDARGRDAGAAS
jgi:small multidrug resistance pump